MASSLHAEIFGSDEVYDASEGEPEPGGLVALVRAAVIEGNRCDGSTARHEEATATLERAEREAAEAAARSNFTVRRLASSLLLWRKAHTRSLCKRRRETLFATPQFTTASHRAPSLCTHAS